MASEPKPKLQVYDPPLCCSSGVCGPAVDPVLPRFAADLEWLKEQGVEVARYNLAQQPGAFVANPAVQKALEEDGNEGLPLLVVGGAVVSRGAYPTREELAEHAGLGAADFLSRYSPSVAELVAIGAAIGANCEPCFRYHYAQARKLGLSKEDVAKAVATARMVKETPARSILALAERYLGRSFAAEDEGAAPGACCAPGGETPSKCC
jgi:AhpD family alkylhydroperoxidase